MDLSSLEGPALHDQRFPASRLRNIDRPRGEVTVWDGDRRGSSRSSHSHRSSTPSVIQSNSATAHEGGKLTVRTRPGSGREKKSSCPFRRRENRRRINHSRSQNAQSSILSYGDPPSGHSGNHSSLPLSSSASGGQNQSHPVPRTASNDHLIWLDDQQIWISTASPTSTAIPHAQNNSSYRLNPNPENPASPQYYGSRANEQGDSDELPPSYESHGFIQNRMGQESRWMTVAQRVGRLSLS